MKPRIPTIMTKRYVLCQLKHKCENLSHALIGLKSQENVVKNIGQMLSEVGLPSIGCKGNY